ncbi:hypothetical protein AB6A40_010092 [Gnathostoma spinigerum]|uniref:Uncharacterized protein n=1 Tax=Gnathostoma spinigerum TaxID=75299 RepID=A0ABD6F144_9BILA
MTSIEEPNGMRRMMDTLVAGYLGRQHYTNTMRSMMRESPILKANIVEDIGIPIMLNDTVHGKHLEEILILFNHYGRFNFSTDFVDFGHRLRCLVNEYSSLIGMYSEWSESQRTLYGRHVPNSAQARKFQLMQQEPLTITSYDGLDSHHHGDQGPCSAGSSDHNATRRKCHQPININDRKSTKKSQVLAELVEPLTQLSQYVHDAGLIQSKLSAEDSLQSAQSVQQLADTAVASEQLGTSQSVSLISIDDNAIGSLDRCLGRENMYDLISQIERDFPPNFFGDNNIQTQFVMDSDDPQSMYTSYADQSNLLQGSNTLENISDGNVNRVQDDYIVPLKCTSLSTPGANIFSGRNSESSTSNSCEGGKELMFSSVGDLQTVS